MAFPHKFGKKKLLKKLEETTVVLQGDITSSKSANALKFPKEATSK